MINWIKNLFSGRNRKIKAAAAEFRKETFGKTMMQVADMNARNKALSEKQLKELQQEALLLQAGYTAKKHGLSGSDEEVMEIVNAAWKDLPKEKS